METCDGIMELPDNTERSRTVQIEVPKGCTLKCDPKAGVEVLKIHYAADPEKNSDWVGLTKPTYQSEALWQQEQEIKADAFRGQLLFPEFQRQYTVMEPQPIPPDVTFYMAIDPHPRRPHAFLWMYVDRYDNHVYFREWWPSKIYGKRGRIPEDDEIYHLDDYAETVKWLESGQINFAAPNGFSDNQGRNQTQYRRIMDPAGKAWATERESGKDLPETFWDTYEK
jgi:hypothetical protein